MHHMYISKMSVSFVLIDAISSDINLVERFASDCQLPHCYSCNRTHVPMQTLCFIEQWHQQWKSAFSFTSQYLRCRFLLLLLLLVHLVFVNIACSVHEQRPKNSCVRYALFQCTAYGISAKDTVPWKHTRISLAAQIVVVSFVFCLVLHSNGILLLQNGFNER